MAVHREGSRSEHVVVVLPSLSFGPSVEAYYGARLPSLEHRFLLLLTMLRRLPGCEVVVVMSVAPDPAVWDYYLDLAGAGDRADVARRAHLVTLDDPSQRPLATKLLDRADLLDQIRDLVAGRPGFIEPYNVTAAEVRSPSGCSCRSTAPRPRWPRWGTRAVGGGCSPKPESRCQSGGRTCARSTRWCAPRSRSTPPTPRRARSSSSWTTAPPGWATWCSTCPTRRPEGRAVPARATEWAARGGSSPSLPSGAVVEERIIGDRFASPSVQADIEPGGRVIIRGTHIQDLSGPHGHTYEGCRFPADPGYSALLAQHARAVGQVLARRGVSGGSAWTAP